MKKLILLLLIVLVVGAVAVGVSSSPDEPSKDVKDQPNYEAYSYGLVEAMMEKQNPYVSYTMGDTSSIDSGKYNVEHGIIMWYENGLHEVRYAVHIGYIDGEYVVGKVLIGDEDVYRNNENMALIGAM